jgi:site-specific DNA-adenine methylase
MVIIADIKKDINNFLKEIQDNTGKLLETLKEETQNHLKNYRKTQSKR